MSTQISSPADRKKIKDAIIEISDSMTRIAGERDFINEAVKAIADEFDLSKKDLKKMARIYYKQSFQTEQAEMAELESLYITIIDNKE